MQSLNRSTRDLLFTSSSTSVGHTVTHASQPVHRSSLMLWMSSFFCVWRFFAMRAFIPFQAADKKTQRIANPTSPPTAMSDSMGRVHYKSSAQWWACDSRGLPPMYWGLDARSGTPDPGSHVGGSRTRVDGHRGWKGNWMTRAVP